jgi:hypothetical protein
MTSSTAGGAAGRDSGAQHQPPPPPPPAAKHQQQQQQDQEEDCLGCRVTGLMLGLGGAGYLSSSLWLGDPRPRGAHRAAILASSAALLALGLGRAAGF